MYFILSSYLTALSRSVLSLTYGSILFIITAFPAHATNSTEYENCILQKLSLADENTLAFDLNNACIPPAQNYNNKEIAEYSTAKAISPIHDRLSIEKSNEFKEFTLTPYKPNFILPVSYNHSGYNPDFHRQQFNEPDLEFDDTESQFQISIKTLLALDLFNQGINLYTGYTNRSFWQVYNKKQSSPFRETNHEPEIWFQTTRSTKFFDFNNRINMIGISHQSNGQGGELSRSWNRAYANFVFERESLVFGIKLWNRFNETPDKDDNPDITDYMGHGEFSFLYKHNLHTISLMSRNNLESGFERGAVELGWSFPIADRKDIKGYVQIFSGYAESLIDYDQTTNRIGFGILLSDWL